MNEQKPHAFGMKSVLIVDDDAINRELLGFIVAEKYRVVMAGNGREALDILRGDGHRISLVLLDLLMPVMDGFAVLREMHEDAQLRQIPTIVLTSETEAEIESLHSGAADFIKKPYDMPEVIMARIDRAIELAEDRYIIHQVENDELTGLYTKEFFFQHTSALDRDVGMHMDAVVVDLDHFHLYNEMHGRQLGDRVLRRVADAIRRELEETVGVGCRCEADTFYMYCAHRDDHEQMCERIAHALTSVDEGIIHVRMGVCTRSDMRQDVVGRFDRARAACNTVRGNYLRNVAYYDDELYRRDIQAQRLIGDMKDAIAKKQFTLHFQPKYAVQGEEPALKSAEALVRWQHPAMGIVSPGMFIPLFEANGMIRELDSYVWNEAAAQVAQWRDRYGVLLPVSVNVSRIDLLDAELLERLKMTCKAHAIPNSALLLEITESAYAEDQEQALQVIRELRSNGFLIEMDDFGSGYSSLNMLLQMPLDAMKIDAKFMRSVSEEKGNVWLLGVLTDIARHLNVPTIFEGVEEEAQVRMIRENGGDMIQGYYFSKPLPAAQFEKLIEKDMGRTGAC